MRDGRAELERLAPTRDRFSSEALAKAGRRRSLAALVFGPPGWIWDAYLTRGFRPNGAVAFVRAEQREHARLARARVPLQVPQVPQCGAY